MKELPSALVTCRWLAANLNLEQAQQEANHPLRVVDACWRGDGTSSRELYRQGHIPGAVNLHASPGFLNQENWNYLPPSQIRAKAEAAGLSEDQRIITYCGVGISASLGLFGLHLAGYKNLALYDASWEEWGTDPNCPVEISQD